eukprot:2490652-Prorocentrum_lima.AAC.1
MHSRDAGVHASVLKGGSGPRLGETSQAPRYRPSNATMPGPKGLCAMAARQASRLCCGITWVLRQHWH